MFGNKKTNAKESIVTLGASFSFVKNGPSGAALGGGIVYSLDSANDGTEDLTNFVLEDVLPTKVNIWTIGFNNAACPIYDISIRTSDLPLVDKQVVTGATTPSIDVDLSFYTPPGARVLSVKVTAPTFVMGSLHNFLQLNGYINTTAAIGDVIQNTATLTADSSTGPLVSTKTSDTSIVYANNGFIGEFVWNDLNGNGIYDFNEPGINDVTVELYDSTGTTLLNTTTTATRGSKPGFYVFPFVAAGTYKVKFIPPVGYGLTVQNLVFNGSTPNPTTGFTNEIVILEHENNLYINAGVVAQNLGSIGNFVWNDLNENGIHEPNEPGVNGVTVELYDAVNMSLLATKITANNISNQPGYYSFDGLLADSYIVKFIPPVGYALTIQNLVTNGSTPNPATGLTNIIVLASNEQLTNMNAGVIEPCSPPVINTTIYTALLNSVYDPMVGVSAFDCKGNNITANVIVTENTVNTAVAGQYTVTYQVTDYKGQTTIKTVTITVYAPTPLDQAITDIIESVALEQTALSHILNAEGEKVQKVMLMDITDTEILKVNQSVSNMVKAISLLEIVLQAKLEAIKCKACPANTKK